MKANDDDAGNLIQEWFTSNRGLNEGLFFGDESTLTKSIESSVLASRECEALKLASDYVNRKFRQGDMFCHANCDEIDSRLQGLAKFFAGANAWEKNRETCPSDLVDAVNAFELAWPSDTGMRDPWQLQTDNETASGTVENLIRCLKGQFSVVPYRGLNIVQDLIRLYFKVPASVVNEAITPVLLYQQIGTKKYGRVVWLTVELILDGGVGFAPDPVALGMTSICYPSNDEDKLLNVMDRIWKLSKVESLGFRGRWKLTTKCPHAQTLTDFKQNDDHNSFNLQHVFGRSIEAAALVAILAASGDIDYGGFRYTGSPGRSARSFRDSARAFKVNHYMPFAINPRVAISASIVQTQRTETITQCHTLTVEGLGPKIGAAREYKLAKNVAKTLIDTVILHQDQPTIDEISAINAEKNAAESGKYEGLNIEYVNTIGDALNWMLEVNVWKKALFDQDVENWEKQWGWARDEHGFFIDCDGKQIVNSKFQQDSGGNWIDGDGNVACSNEEWERRRVNTGSLEYMQAFSSKPIQGAMENTPEDKRSETDNDQVLADDQ